jgi:hypothetical protein
VLQIARKRLQEKEGKMRKLTRGSKRRDEHRRSRSGEGFSGGRRFDSAGDLRHEELE